VAAGSGGLAGILGVGASAGLLPRRPASTGCAGPIFVPASDKLLREKIVPEGEKALGMKIRFETINGQRHSGAGHLGDPVGQRNPTSSLALNNWPQLYATSLADVSDVTEEIGKTQGGYYDMCKSVGTYQGKWIGVPWAVGGGLVAYRKSWLAEAGY